MSARMRHRGLRAAAAGALWLLPLVAGAQDFPTTPPAPLPLAPAQFPPFREATLPNGVQLLVVENRKQPVIAVSLSFQAGAIHEPAAKAGLASMMAGLLNKGAGARSAEQFAEAIEGVGGSFSAAAGDDFLTLYVNTLSRDAALAFDLLADAARRPTFPAAEVELLRTQTLSGIQLAKSQPAAIAERIARRFTFGEHPYGRTATEGTVRAITRDDVVAYHQARIRPRGALLVVAGAMSLAEARTLATRAFAGWTGAPAPAAPVVAIPQRTRSELVLVHRPGSVQSNVIMGNTLWAPGDPRSYATTVATEALGGGSEGRLFRILREEKGWTYGAYAGLTSRRAMGTFTASGEFRTDVTDSAVTVMLAQQRELRDAPLPETEFADRLGSLTGRFPLQVETAEQVANRVATARLLGLPADYVPTYRQRLAAVTRAEAQAAAAAAFRPDAGLIVVVGDGERLWPRLKGLAAEARLVDVEGRPLDPADLAPKASALALDWSKLEARSDSFTVLLQGNPFGYQRSQLERTADGWTLSGQVSLGPILNQALTARISPTGALRAVRQEGTVQGQALLVDITVTDGRARGEAKTPGPTGPTTTAVDVALPEGTVADEFIGTLLSLLPIAPGARIPLTVFQSDKGTVAARTLAIEAQPEQVTVPLGTFPALRATLEGSEQPTTWWISAQAPYRILKTAFQGAPLEIVRVR